jgi:hypothetical protein
MVMWLSCALVYRCLRLRGCKFNNRNISTWLCFLLSCTVSQGIESMQVCDEPRLKMDSTVVKTAQSGHPLPASGLSTTETKWQLSNSNTSEYLGDVNRVLRFLLSVQAVTIEGQGVEVVYPCTILEHQHAKEFSHRQRFNFHGMPEGENAMLELTFDIKLSNFVMIKEIKANHGDCQCRSPLVQGNHAQHSKHVYPNQPCFVVYGPTLLTCRSEQPP